MIQFVDISHGQRYDDLVRKKNFATMLNATVSHEMRTPINSIQQSVIAYKMEIDEIKNLKEQLKESLFEDNTDMEKFIKHQHKTLHSLDKTLNKIDFIDKNLKTSSKLLGFYVQDLLDVSQIKAGTITKNIKQVNLNKVLHEVLNLQEISAEMKQVSITLKRLEDPYIDIDADRIQ